MAHKKLLLSIFDGLLDCYGPRQWWPARTRFEVIVGAVLAQNVSWRNAKIAVQNLRKYGLLSPSAIISASHEEIASRIRTSRFYNQKTKKLKFFCSYLMTRYDGSLSKMFSMDLETLRAELLTIGGIGKETADSILLYAGKKLSFVSDAYTKRFLERYGHFGELLTYDQIRKFFMLNLPKDLYIYNEYHALIVHHEHMTCKSTPCCNKCPVQKLDSITFCEYGMNMGNGVC